MPPKQKITPQMILDESFLLARLRGYESINARTIGELLHCSTQPIFSHYASMDDLKKDVYQKTYDYFCHYINDVNLDEDILFAIAHRYILFGYQESHLFCFLFQSKIKTEIQFLSVVKEIIYVDQICQQQQLTHKQFLDMYQYFFTFVHSYASMLANGMMEYHYEVINQQIKNVYRGMRYTIERM